jgi:fimbrial isopeptide formation D2 family protein
LYIELTKTASAEQYSTEALPKPISYTISFSMPGDLSRFEKIKIEDVIPAGLEYIEGSYKLLIGEHDVTSEVSLEPGTRSGKPTLYVVIDDEDLLVFSEGRDVALTLGFNVLSSADGELKNTGNVYFTPEGEAEPGEPDGSDYAVITPLEIIISPPENFTKTASQSTFTGVGDTVVYTVSFTLPNSVLGYEGLLLYDALPSALTYVSAEASVNNTPLTVGKEDNKISVYINKAALAGNTGKEVVLEITATVNNTWVAGNIINSASIFIQRNPETQPDPEEDEPDVETKPEIIVPIIVPENFTKEASRSIFTGVGDDVVYTISFTLPGDVSGYEGLLVFDDLPAMLTTTDAEAFVNSTPLTVGMEGNRISVYIDKITLETNAGKNVELTITAYINDLWSGGNITNTASIYIQRNPDIPPAPEEDEPDIRTEPEIISPPVISEPENFIKKASKSIFTGVGDEIVYTISFTLPGVVSGYEGLLLYDALPSTLTSKGIVAFIDGEEYSVIEDGDKINVYIEKEALEIYAGKEVVLEITATVNNTWVSGNITNSASVYIQRNPDTQPDPEVVEPDITTEAIITPLQEITPVPPQNFAKAASKLTFTGIGDTIVYTISFTLPEDVSGYEGLLVYDALPSTLTYIGASAAINNNTLSVNNSSGNVSVYINKTTLLANAGKNFVLTITASVNNTWISGSITNAASLFIQRNEGAPPNPAGDEPDGETSVTTPPAAVNPPPVTTTPPANTTPPVTRTPPDTITFHGEEPPHDSPPISDLTEDGASLPPPPSDSNPTTGVKILPSIILGVVAGAVLFIVRKKIKK